MADDLPVLTFANKNELRRWLQANHAKAPGLWLKIYKKATGVPTVVYDEAVDEALCFGWIDGQRKGLDWEAFLQRFTPRRPQSIWSKVNRERIARLVAEGRMQAAGLAEVERAKADGRWEAAYDSPKDAKLPPDFEAALAKNRAAKSFLATLDKREHYAIVFRLHGAKKAETRQRRIETFIARLAAGTKITAPADPKPAATPKKK